MPVEAQYSCGGGSTFTFVSRLGYVNGHTRKTIGRRVVNKLFQGFFDNSSAKQKLTTRDLGTDFFYSCNSLTPQRLSMPEIEPALVP